MFGFKLYFVEGTSMEPSVNPKSIVLVKTNIKKLKEGQVVVFFEKKLNKNLIKRVKLAQDNKVYLLGDNLAHSIDSRSFGFIEIKDILGIVIYIFK